MKASVQFRDEQRPLLRAKLPINILNFPFQSGIVAGSSKELALHLTTFFDSGPSIKLAYKPNDASDHFSLVVKTGTGKYGSPIDSCMVMSAQFNLCAGGNANPSFFVHFKPRFGDFGIWKKQGSVLAENGIKVVDDLNPVVGDNFEVLGMNKIKSLQERLLKGVEIGAVTSLPVLNMANVKFRWGVRLPTEMTNVFGEKDGLVINRPLPAVSFRSLPYLVMNKISIEHVRGKETNQAGSEMIANGAEGRDVSMMCLGVRHELEVVRGENEMLRKAVEDLRSEISNGKKNAFVGDIKHKEVGRGGVNKPKDVRAEGRSADHAKEDVKKH